MKTIAYMAATALTAVVATGAQAATPVANVYPAAKISGNGASSIAVVLTEELNCFGGPNNPLGFGADGSKETEADFNFVPAKPTTANPDYNCASQSVQPNVDGKYVSTGSGGGRGSWANLNTSGIAVNPFTAADFPNGHVQFAFSDSAISSTDVTTYTNNAATAAGAPIQFPIYVTPIAIGYNPVYGKRNNGGTVVPLTLNVKSSFRRTDGSGGLRLSKKSYCGILNGTITNWNDPQLQIDNGKQPLFDPNNDTAARWSSAGAPIKLVGRSDNSGTTNITTRALAAQCGSLVANNNYSGGTDALPAAVKSDAVYNKQTGVLTSGTETPGKFGTVNGSDGVATVISRQPADPAVGATVVSGSYLGYVGADWVLPAPNATRTGTNVQSASLQVASGTSYQGPTAAQAIAAFKGILPPQSSTAGKYQATGAAGSLPGNRTDPTSWAIPNATTLSDGSPNKLANPAAGYPITGTTNVLLYTCYANPAIRTALDGFLAFHLGKVAKDSTGAPVPAKLVSDPKIGLLAVNGIAAMPAQWVTAIYNTFLTQGADTHAAGIDLWIQNKLPAKTADIANLSSNPSCSGKTGA